MLGSKQSRTMRKGWHLVQEQQQQTQRQPQNKSNPREILYFKMMFCHTGRFVAGDCLSAVCTCV